MADQLGHVADGSEGKGSFERLLRLGVLGLFAFAGLTVIGDWLQKIIDNTKRSHIEGDFETIGKALDRRDLKDPYLETDLTNLQGEELASVPRDPWGSPYYYDWFSGRLVSAGPDLILGTRVPGVPENQIGTSTDDEVKHLKSASQLVVAVKDGDGSAIQMISQTGEEIRELTKLPGKTITGLDALGGVVMVSSAQGDKFSLTSITFANGLDQLPLLEPPYSQQMADVFVGPEEVGAPCLYSHSNDWTFFSLRKKGGSWDLCKVGYKDKQKAPLRTTGDDETSPSVDVGEKLIYYSWKSGKGTGIYRFPMSSYQAPTLVVKADGVDFRNPAPAPVGDLLAYLEVRGGTTVLKVMDEKKNEILAASDAMAGTCIVWAPTGDKLGYFVQGAQGPVLTLVHVRRKVFFALDFLQSPIEPVRFAWIAR